MELERGSLTKEGERRGDNRGKGERRRGEKKQLLDGVGCFRFAGYEIIEMLSDAENWSETIHI
ncbi:hypothetical protein [Halomicrobium sp. LC1Hm]|uniref:hypothetical protein n=1 Tax=Halomicrobium sp. LC1Hm TaxID=2610902 RepID=UPI0012983AFE|nr:hypothetical protein [Halomicrobium sp. LC1Hm]